MDSVTRAMPDYDVVVHGIADMDELVPERGSLVERTNLYRTRLLYRHGGWWVDSDCYALRPFNSDKPYSFGAQEMAGAAVDWAFGSEGLTALVSSLGEHMAKELGGRKLEPSHVYGSRRFSRRPPSSLLPKNATLIHLFLGSWYRKGWRKGVMDKVKEVVRW